MWGKVALCVALLALPGGATRQKSHLVSKWHSLVDKEDVAGMAELKASGEEDMNVIGNGGQTPLMYAVLSGKLEAVKQLLALGADASIPEKDGYTPVHGAGFQGRAKIMEHLIQKGLDPRDMHVDGFEPIHRACWGSSDRHTATIKVLLDNGVPFDAPTSKGLRPLDMVRDKKSRTYRLLSKYAKAAAEKEAAEKEEL